MRCWCGAGEVARVSVGGGRGVGVGDGEAGGRGCCKLSEENWKLRINFLYCG